MLVSGLPCLPPTVSVEAVSVVRSFPAVTVLEERECFRSSLYTFGRCTGRSGSSTSAHSTFSESEYFTGDTPGSYSV